MCKCTHNDCVSLTNHLSSFLWYGNRCHMGTNHLAVVAIINVKAQKSKEKNQVNSLFLMGKYDGVCSKDRYLMPILNNPRIIA